MKKFLVFAVALFATLMVFAQASKNVQDQQACDYARKKRRVEVWQDYLRQFPQGMCSFEAKSEIKDLQTIGNLQWSNRSSSKMNWSSAKQYCENLSESGFDDWRLPSISELRTTIKNCSGSQSGGSCRISDSCLSSVCFSIDCACEYRGNNGGYYSKLGDDDNVRLWSSSVISDYSNTALVVSFVTGLVGPDSLRSNYDVRCVRNSK